MSEQLPDSAEEIEKIARTLLLKAKAFGVFPTPVDRIIREAKLSLAKGVDLSKAEAGFFVKLRTSSDKSAEKSWDLSTLEHKPSTWTRRRPKSAKTSSSCMR